MNLLKHLGLERLEAVEKEPVVPIEDTEALLRLAEKNSEVQAVLDTYEQNMKDITTSVMVGGGVTTSLDRGLIGKYAIAASKSLQELGYEVPSEIIDQSL